MLAARRAALSVGKKGPKSAGTMACPMVDLLGAWSDLKLAERMAAATAEKSAS
jgi:hypothetical protein